MAARKWSTRAPVVRRQHQKPTLPRRIGAIVGGACLVAMATVAPVASAQAQGRRFHPPVASDCSEDVTDDVNAWLVGVPDGSTIDLRKDGCYLSNGTILFESRNNITIHGHGATIKADVDAPDGENRARLKFDLGGGFVVRDLILQGRNFTPDCAVYGQPSCFSLVRSFDRGVLVVGSDGVLFDNVQILNSWLDGLEVTAHRYLPFDEPPPVNARNVTVQNSRVETTGRHAFACSGCRNFTLRNNTITNIGYDAVDVELEFPGQTGDVTMIGNRVSNIWLSLLGVAWPGPGLGPIVVRDNVMADAGVTCHPPINFNEDARGANGTAVTIANNSLHSYKYGIAIQDVARADVTGNTIRIDSQNACLNASHPEQIPTTGVLFDNVASGSITRNTLINANPLVRLLSSTATVCGNRSTTTGAFDQPAPCDNPLPTATIVTTATPTTRPGGTISDTAMFSGLAGSGPFGTVTFSAFLNDGGCETGAVLTSASMTVPANGTPVGSGKLQSTSSGTYTWKVDYSGNADNNPVSQCGGSGETSVVGTLATPTIGTRASAGGPVGTWVNDTATLTGGTNPTGTVTFVLFDDAACANQVFTSTEPLTEGTTTSANFPSAAPGTYFWRAFYNGDANNNAVSGPCDAPNESVAIG